MPTKYVAVAAEEIDAGRWELVEAAGAWIARDLGLKLDALPIGFMRAAGPAGPGDREGHGDPPVVAIHDGPDTSRGFFHERAFGVAGKRAIFLDHKLLGRDLLAVLAHELRHASQSADVLADPARAEADARRFEEKILVAWGVHSECRAIHVHDGPIMKYWTRPPGALGWGDMLYSPVEQAVYINKSASGPQWERVRGLAA